MHNAFATLLLVITVTTMVLVTLTLERVRSIPKGCPEPMSMFDYPMGRSP